MSDLLTFGGSALSGGIFGLIGTLGGRVASFFERKQSHRFEMEKMDRLERQRADERKAFVQEAAHELELVKVQANVFADQQEQELRIVDRGLSREGVNASLAHDASFSNVSPWVNNTRGVTRPVLTFCLWIIVCIIFLFTKDQEITSGAIFAAMSATLWWFGDRARLKDTYDLKERS